jgi:C4-dicarboxylate-specific signal transduction histidine kinase
VSEQPGVELTLAFLGLDAEAREALRSAAPFLDEHLPAAMDAFYAKALDFPETRRLFADDDRLRRAREAQMRHWRLLVDGAFDAAYVDAVRNIGVAHARIGLAPNWYVSGYGVVLTFLVRKAFEQAAEGDDAGLTGRQVSALIQAAMMDMELVIAVYLEAAEDAAREARDELARAARVLSVGALASSIAHEVNQPVAAIVTSSEAALRWLDKTPPNLEQAREAIGRIARDANRTSAIVGRTRGMLTKSQSRRRKVDLNVLLREAVQFTETRRRRAAVKVESELSREPLLVLVDPVQIQQVMVNLIANAIEAMEGAPHRRRILKLSSRSTDDGRAWVSIADTGVGVDQDDAERIFTQMFTTKPGGMGLGLSVSKAIVETHGGVIAMARNEPTGAVFTFSLPAAEASDLSA